MNDHELIRALRWLKVETGSLVCLGCVYEHHCSTHGCAVINEAVRRFRSPEVLIYADPPYLLSTRKQRQYRVEMESEDQHEELLKALLAHPGMVMLSGYDSDMYNDMRQGWICLRHESKVECGGKRTECLWCNFDPQISSLFFTGD